MTPATPATPRREAGGVNAAGPTTAAPPDLDPNAREAAPGGTLADAGTGAPGPTDDGEPFDALYSRSLTLVRDREVWLWIRQSTHDQRLRNQGSESVQRQQARYVAPLGVTPDAIHTVDARGESGAAGADRPLFRQMLQAAEAGRIGILLLARHDRLARNDTDSAAIYDALARYGGLVMVDGRVYDPGLPEDSFMLKMLSAFAEFENKARTRWVMLARWALVTRQGFRVRLPTGLVWASPEDEQYVAQAERAGLRAWIDRAVADPTLYRARSSWVDRVGPMVAGMRDPNAPDGDGGAALWPDSDGADGTRPVDAATSGDPMRPAPDGRWLLPLPFPDADVARSVELRLAWIRETGSITAVLARIRTHPEWPRHGLVPVAPGRLWHPDHTARWRPATRIVLKRWYCSPALYGTYAATSRLARSGRGGVAGRAR